MANTATTELGQRYVLLCEDLGDDFPDKCFLRLIDLETNAVTLRSRFTLFSLLSTASYDLLTDNLNRALNYAYVWRSLEA